ELLGLLGRLLSPNAGMNALPADRVQLHLAYARLLTASGRRLHEAGKRVEAEARAKQSEATLRVAVPIATTNSLDSLGAVHFERGRAYELLGDVLGDAGYSAAFKAYEE